MSRANWKGPFIDSQYFNQLDISTKNKIKKIKIARNTEIIPNFVGLTFNIYNGKLYSEITVTENMIGHKFGEFVFTRSKYVFKKKDKKKLAKKK